MTRTTWYIPTVFRFLVVAALALVPATAPALDSGEPSPTAPVRPVGHQAIPWQQDADCHPVPDGFVPPDPFRDEILAGRSRQLPGAAAYPSFIWPMAHALHDGNILVNYVDNSPSTSIVDYMGNPHAYDGHNGTDITLYHFRDMDRGFPVLAAAAGEVTSVVWFRGDRNFQSPFPDNGNYIWIRHSDSMEYSVCYHLRTNSPTVEVGDLVQAGDTIALIGSSGFSSDAHLHFEVGQSSGGWNPRDPWNGSFNTLPSLWTSQEPYVGDDLLRVQEFDVTTEAAAGGNLGAIPTHRWKDRMTSPAVFGAGEPTLAVWFLIQGQASDTYTLRVRRPDNSVYGSVNNYNLGGKWRYGWHLWFFNWIVFSGDFGTWSMEIEHNSSIIAQRTFEVGANTVFGPRLYPLAGRSFRLNGVEQRDTLRIESLGGPVTYSLINAPSFVSLQDDSVVVLDAISTTTGRSTFFQAQAVDGSGRADTMWYHIVDFSRPWVCYPDADDDGYGEAGHPGMAAVTDESGNCLPGTSDNNLDCIDTNSTVYPGAIELCDGLDNDCNDLVDDACVSNCLIENTGDVNIDGSITSADIIALVNFTFKGGASPFPCDAAGDVNCTGSITSSDVIGLVNFTFKGGAPPCDVCTIIPELWTCP